MNDIVEFLEFGEFVNPLEKLARDYTDKGGTAAGLSILQQGATLSKELEGGGKLNALPAVRESIRRNVEIDEDEIDHLGKLAEEVGEESYGDHYILMELVQAAAVASCGLFKRNLASERLAVAAKGFGKFERARESYNDAIEGLQICTRFFSVDRAAFSQAEQRLRNEWNRLKERSEKQLDIFDPVTTDPAAEWMELLLWDSDLGSEAGLLAQVDSMLRLALRWEHWLDQKGLPLGPQAREMIRRCDALKSSGDDWLSLRFIITIGDALVEVREWQEAAGVYEYFLERASAYAKQPIGLHAVAQGAYCHLMAGASDRCRDWLSKFPRTSAEALSRNVVTVAAELARYITIEDLCGRKCGHPASKSAHDRVAELMKFVSMIVRGSPSNRMEYLQTLFFTVLARDVESMSDT
jgi:hypothetical protein